MTRVLVADPISQEGIKTLEKKEISVIAHDVSLEELNELIENTEGLIVRSRTKVTRELLSKAKNLIVIGRCGVGTDNIDMKAAEELGVKVVTAAGAHAASVAELTVGLMLAVFRKIPMADAAIKNQKWTKKQLAPQLRLLKNKTLGLIGCGMIGWLVAKVALAMGMKVRVFDIIDITLPEGDAKQVSRDEVLVEADVISFHVPLNKHTSNMVNADMISKMKEGVVLINTSRGGIIMEDDLIEALRSGKVGGAGLDVFQDEPNPRKDLVEMNNVVCTPHIGSQTIETQDELAKLTAERVSEILLTK